MKDNANLQIQINDKIVNKMKGLNISVDIIGSTMFVLFAL